MNVSLKSSIALSSLRVLFHFRHAIHRDETDSIALFR